MSDFEFMFALFGLLLGLSIAELLAGLARCVEERLRPSPAYRVGLLTPALAAFVLLDLLSFWSAAWLTRDIVQVSGRSLLLVTAFASAYYLAARLVFPRDTAGMESLDDHFYRIRRVVIGILFALLVVQMAWYASQPAIAPRLFQLHSVIFTLVLAALMALAAFVKKGRWVPWLLAALIGRYVLGYVIF